MKTRQLIKALEAFDPDTEENIGALIELLKQLREAHELITDRVKDALEEIAEDAAAMAAEADELPDMTDEEE